MQLRAVEEALEQNCTALHKDKHNTRKCLYVHTIRSSTKYPAETKMIGRNGDTVWDELRVFVAVLHKSPFEPFKREFRQFELIAVVMIQRISEKLR